MPRPKRDAALTAARSLSDLLAEADDALTEFQLAADRGAVTEADIAVIRSAVGLLAPVAERLEADDFARRRQAQVAGQASPSRPDWQQPGRVMRPEASHGDG